MRCVRSVRSRSARWAARRSAASSPSIWARRIADAPCCGAARRCSMIQAARCASSAAAVSACDASRSARSACSRAASAAATAASAGSHAARAACSACTAASLAAMSSSRRLRSASTRSSPPSGAWRISRWRPCQTRPARLTATPVKPAGSCSSSSTTHVFHSSRRATARTRSSPPTNFDMWRAPGAGGLCAAAGPGAIESRISTRPPSAPAASSSARPSRTPSASEARSWPPSAAATARS